MLAFVSRLFAITAIACVFSAGAALSQSGGFVFDEPEPEPPAEVPADPIPEPEPEAPSIDLDTFTFGGNPDAGQPSAVSEEERTAYAEAEAAGTVAAYRAFLESYPDSSLAEDARARVAALQAEEDRRLALITSCDKLAGDPEDPGLGEGVAGVALADIDADGALWTCSRARAAAPDLPRLSYNLARISEAQGQEQSALRGYRIALRLAIERTGEPYLQAAEGILRLAGEPRNPTESMASFLLQFAVDSDTRLKALKLREAELEAALAVAAAKAEGVASRTAELEAEVEFLRAREIDLLSTLDTAETKGAGAEEAAAALAAVQAELAAKEEQIRALRSELATVTDLLETRAAEDEQNKIAIEALGSDLNTALARLAQEEKRATELQAENASLTERLEEATARLEETRALLEAATAGD